jgi:hypothetical protein
MMVNPSCGVTMIDPAAMDVYGDASSLMSYPFPSSAADFWTVGP